MSYPFINAGSAIQKTPKQDYTDLFQENLWEQFYNSTDWYTIEEETSLASGVYQNVDARITVLINTNTGERIEDDFKRLLFNDINHPVSLGKMYRFDSNYWVTVNVDKIKTLSSTATIRRCNNVLRWLDETSGSIYEFPCSLGYLIKENRDYSTAGSAIVVPSGMLECVVQFNSYTNRIKPNQRFLFGNSNNWSSYRVEGGGINNFNNLNTSDNMSSGLIKFSLAVDYSNLQTDDVTNGIANTRDNVYEITLNPTTISGNATQTIQLIPTVTLNGDTVTRSLVWTSNDVTKATVSSGGLVTLVATGSCIITCQLLGNSNVTDTCTVTVGTSPVDDYQVVLTPNSNVVLEGEEKTWVVALYKNGVVQADVFSFVLDQNTVPSANFTYTYLGSNSFKIKNIKKFLTDTLDITATSGSHSMLIQINLRGAW